MPSNHKILVVGTTADYIDWIRRARPGDALFITDPMVRRMAVEARPSPAEELCCDLTATDRTLEALNRHLARHHLLLDGIACFDCESMELAAALASYFRLPYPSVAAVRNCRNKLLAKTLWHERHLNTPPAMALQSADAATRFFKAIKGPIVLKPSSGSGSELVFNCASAADSARNYQLIRQGLGKRRTHRLYWRDVPDAPCIMAEAMVNGQEYSCDFTVHNGRTQVIRLTRKIASPGAPFGTILAYLLTTAWPSGVDAHLFQQTLWHSAAALGIEHAVCMLDFIVSKGCIHLLELAPRPGGDCLPFLLRQATGVDILGLQLDFSRHQRLSIPHNPNGRPLAGLRVHARRKGILKSIDSTDLEKDHRVLEIHMIRQPGHEIVLPPDDYDTWLLGHIIFAPHQQPDVETQCRTLMGMLKIEIE